MTDQTIPAQPSAEDLEMAREWVQSVLSGRAVAVVPWEEAVARVLGSLLPRPTLADMTDEERDACRWMQCDVRNAVVTHGVLAKNHGGDAHVLDAEGEVWFLSPTDVTPRPDLPRLEWPGDTPTAPGHLAVGAVIKSAGDPRIDALPVGSILLDRDEAATMKRPWEWEGEGYIPIPEDGAKFGPWTVLHIPKEADQ